MDIEIAKRLIGGALQETAHPESWVDLGAGTGLFTRALAGFLPSGSVVYAVDSDGKALEQIPRTLESVRTVTADFITQLPEVGPLNGVLMANALHYVKDKPSFLTKVRRLLLRPHRMILVEYDRETSNRWVPYPLSYAALLTLAHEQSFRRVTRLGEVPSLYGDFPIYAALVEM